MDQQKPQNQQNAAPEQKPSVSNPQTGNPPIQNPGQQRPASDTAPRDPNKPAGGHETMPRDYPPGQTPPKT
jgi:hypothetical protein